MKPVFAAISLAVALGSPAAANDEAANAVYERMAASYRALDPASLDKVYAPGATYNPRNAKAGIDDYQRLMTGLSGFQRQVKDKGGHVDIRFRVAERKRLGDVYIDHGFVRTTYILEKGGAPIISNGKFMTVLAKQPDGNWAIVSDADSDTPPEAFDKAVPVAGLKYDQ
ncbi:YybH family protein [Allosphingosinicella vermicomposti]|uniref:YybH family protein n=1 Tax=Allosphingosinicella vermicomposti TaxID=614671 RepID=UPI000D0FE01D|nr:nuclear transport factor 2 family protein [Allosphingosinicella vermicomposti]